MTPQIITLMAEYNRTMNERAYDAAGKLDAAEVAADKGAFFGSILGTLNHIAVADTIWLHRFAGHAAAFPALRAMSVHPLPTSLRERLAPDLPTLRALRRTLDDVIVRWAGEIEERHLTSTLTYRSIAGEPFTRSFGAIVQHFFNHQTHHRGQVSTLLFQSGVDIGVTDLVAMVPSIEA